ncbi:MAG: hypothetical protein FD122_2679 [Stygiobacter sp.]|nr:MAG: hypothetical protein FD122_2679 [Stygiobacter sp.]KAF0215214.1 MAG: hypothetical protein FD178_1853 [Ignavibacteria bacterium]
MNIQYQPELKIYKNNKVYDLSEFVQSMQITKSLRNPVGSFSVVLNPTLSANGKVGILTNKIFNEINAMLAVNDVIAGKIDKRSKRHSFLGLTSQHIEVGSSMGGQTSRSIMITGGFALPKMLLRDSIIMAPSLSVTPEVLADPVLKERAQFFEFLRGVKDEKSPFLDTPEVAVKYILNNAVATNIKIYDGKEIKSLFPPADSGIKDYNGNYMCNFKFLGRESLYGSALSSYSGNLLNYIHECLDKEFYEVFFDTTSGSDGIPYNTMTIRTKPFSHREMENPQSYFYDWTYWEDLTKDAVTVKYEDIFERQIGKSDYELKNFFRVNQPNVLVAQALGDFGLNFPIININSIKRHGLRALEIDSRSLVDTRKLVDEYNRLISIGSGKSFLEIIMEYARQRNSFVYPKTEVKLSSKVVSLANVDMQPPAARSFGAEIFEGLFSKRDKIVEWYAFPYYEAGTLRMPHNEEVTIGRLINLPEYEYYFPLDGKVYKGIKIYPTDVTHTFNYGQIAETRAVVTNGQPDGVVKKWFEHPDNKFTESPLTAKKPGSSFTELSSEEKKFFDGIKQLNIDMLKIEELPNE